MSCHVLHFPWNLYFFIFSTRERCLKNGYFHYTTYTTQWKLTGQGQKEKSASLKSGLYPHCRYLYNSPLHYFTYYSYFILHIILQSTVFHPSLDWVENFPLPTWRPYIFPDKLLIKSVRFYKAKFYRVFAFSQPSYKAGLFSRKIMQKSKMSFNLFQFLKIEICLAPEIWSFSNVSVVWILAKTFCWRIGGPF